MDERFKEMCKNIVFILLIVLVLLVLSITTHSCRTVQVTKEIPVVTEHVTEHHSIDIVRDTMYQRDSVYQIIQGDTVIIERWHHTVNINKMIVADTIRDTIPKMVTVTRTEIKEVNKPPWWQKALAFTGVLSIAAGGIYIFRKLKK